MHEPYQPTEYEQLLVASGTISLADVDPEYQKYLNNPNKEYTLPYERWQYYRNQWNQLATAYETEIEPLYKDIDTPLTWRQEHRADQLLRQMTAIESRLGY